MRTLRLIPFLLFATASLGEQPHKPLNPCLEAGVRDTVVFLGTTAASTAAPTQGPAPAPQFFGTGFLITVDRIPYLVTAKHVIIDSLTNPDLESRLIAAHNLKSGQGVVRPLKQIRDAIGAKWIYADDADLAVLPFPLDPSFQVRTIPLELFATTDLLSELQDVFFLSFHPGLGGQGHITPMFRRGTVALITDSLVFIDAFVFPGNSGSPVFTRPGAVSFVDGGVTPGDPLGCRLVGVVAGYLPYQEEAISTQTKRPRVIFEENTGIAGVTSASVLLKLIASQPFQAQHATIIAKAK